MASVSFCENPVELVVLLLEFVELSLLVAVGMIGPQMGSLRFIPKSDYGCTE